MYYKSLPYEEIATYILNSSPFLNTLDYYLDKYQIDLDEYKYDTYDVLIIVLKQYHHNGKDYTMCLGDLKLLIKMFITEITSFEI